MIEYSFTILVLVVSSLAAFICGVLAADARSRPLRKALREAKDAIEKATAEKITP